jgi:cystathionine gamma-synthase
MPGSLEAWLLLRSLRTLHLRVPRQSETATAIVQWLSKVAATPAGQEYDGAPGGIIEKVWHSSLQGKDARGWEPSEQMVGGWNATFAIKVCIPVLRHRDRLTQI